MLDKVFVGIRGLPVSLQWLLLSVAKAFSGSMILAFAVNYATAYFAVRHGFRVPLEGVPYLSFAVGIAGFATFLLTMPLFLLFVGLAHYTRHTIFVGRLTRRQEAVFGYCIAGMLCGLIVLILAWLLHADFARQWLRHFLPPTFPEEEIRYVAAGLMVAAFFLLMAMWTVSKGFGWIGAQVQAWLVVLVVMLFGLFWHDCYGSFLRLIRYGGGIEVTVRRLPPGANGILSEVRKLLWMTESHVVLFDPGAGLVEEIPRAHIASVIYVTTPDWGLPDRVLHRQPSYIHVGAENWLVRTPAPDAR
jgi:hypothetical protein